MSKYLRVTFSHQEYLTYGPESKDKFSHIINTLRANGGCAVNSSNVDKPVGVAMYNYMVLLIVPPTTFALFEHNPEIFQEIMFAGLAKNYGIFDIRTTIG